MSIDINEYKNQIKSERNSNILSNLFLSELAFRLIVKEILEKNVLLIKGLENW